MSSVEMHDLVTGRISIRSPQLWNYSSPSSEVLRLRENSAEDDEATLFRQLFCLQAERARQCMLESQLNEVRLEPSCVMVTAPMQSRLFLRKDRLSLKAMKG